MDELDFCILEATKDISPYFFDLHTNNRSWPKIRLKQHIKIYGYPQDKPLSKSEGYIVRFERDNTRFLYNPETESGLL